MELESEFEFVVAWCWWKLMRWRMNQSPRNVVVLQVPLLLFREVGCVPSSYLSRPERHLNHEKQLDQHPSHEQ